MSVKKVDSIDFFNQTEKSNTLKLTDNNGYFLPEIRGEIVSGKILSKNNKEIDNKIVSLSFPGKTFSFYNSKTNNKGEFNFILGENHTTENCLIQLQDKEDSQYQVTLNNSSTIEYSDLNFNDITLNQDLKEWLNTKNIENQIENSYFEIKQNKTVPLDPPSPFFLNKGFTYYLDDYTRFSTVKEVFIEIINSAYISGKEDSYQFHVSDAANLEFNQLLNIENPLVLVDGISIVNNNDIVNYDAYNIESITIVPGNYIFGPKIYNGIISILTKKGDFVDTLNGDYTKFNVSIPQEIKILYQPDYLNNNLSRIPDYRSQLLWLPDLELNSAQKTITCFSSDSKGLYEVVLSSYTPEGKRIMIKEFFTVN